MRLGGMPSERWMNVPDNHYVYGLGGSNGYHADGSLLDSKDEHDMTGQSR